MNFGMSLTDIGIEEEHIKELRDQSREALKRLNPAFVFYESRWIRDMCLNLDGSEFKSYRFDTEWLQFNVCLKNWGEDAAWYF